MTRHEPNGRRFQSLLAVTATLLGANLLVQGVQMVSPAVAGESFPPPTNVPPVFDSAGQRKDMIEKLEDISGRLKSIEAKLDKGINVKVTDMPAIKMAEADKPAPPPAPAAAGKGK